MVIDLVIEFSGEVALRGVSFFWKELPRGMTR